MGGRVIVLLLLVVAGTAWAGWYVRRRDPIAAGLLFAFSATLAVLLVAAFFGLIGVAPEGA